MKSPAFMPLSVFPLIAFLGCNLAFANPPEAEAKTGPNVTVTANNDDTVTLSNGIASLVIVKKSARLNSLTYTYNNNGVEKTSETLSGKGQYYYGGFMLGNGTFEYSLATDPATNGGDYADVKLLSTSQNNGVMEVHFSMLRGSPGFYSTASMTHRLQDEFFEVSAWGVVTRVPRIFNWVSADAARNLFIGEPTTKGKGTPNSPHEISVCFDGTQQGNYADKFIFGQDHSNLKAWGWSSVGQNGLNIGRWMMTTMEFSNGGPLKRDVSVYPYSELNNSILTGEVGMGSDGKLAKGELWTKTCGPWFTYLNAVPAKITDPKQAAHALYQDALKRAEMEEKAWPYAWFKHAGFVPAAGRGTVQGKLVINDSGNPRPALDGTWVGLEIQPETCTGTYDFQKWLKPYQFWAQTDANGNFSIPHVIAGKNYTLYAYGPGTCGTFMSQKQVGGNPPFECNVPLKPFAVNVEAGSTVSLGTIIWTPVRIGATVFEMGVPNRKSDEFRHGEDYWLPGTPPKIGFPTPLWGGQMEFSGDFPDGLNYIVGKSQWLRDWNYVLPSLPGVDGAYQSCSGTITFNLPQAPAAGAQASIYLGCAGNDGKSIIVKLNDTNLGTVPEASGVPNALGPLGFEPPYSDTSSIHFSDHGPFCDERINFPSKLLHAGQNTLTIQMDTKSMVAFFMLDYLRLELAGYIPSAPASVSAYPGNNKALVCWPVIPGATSYTILRSTSAASGYAPIAPEFVGQVCGSGARMATYVDTTAVNGTTYYYTVQSVNPGGRSPSSPVSARVTPAPDISQTAPSSPARLRITSSGSRFVTLDWSPVPGAAYYSILRTTHIKDGVGGTDTLRTLLLDDAFAGTTYVDHSPTDGRIYSYQVKAVNVAGISEPATTGTIIPLPAPPAAAPTHVTAEWLKPRNGPALKLSWTPVPGAAGYVIYRSLGTNPSFEWPKDFLATVMSSTYTDYGVTEKKALIKGLNPNAIYSYQITAVNTAGISAPVIFTADPRSSKK